MKKDIIKRLSALPALFLTLLFCASTAHAYKPIYENQKKWMSKVHDPRMGYLLWHEFTEVIGDTVIGGENVKIIDRWRVPNGKHVDSYMFMFGSPKASRIHYYRLEKAGKVYDVSVDGTMSLVMDFDSPVGTSWEYNITDHFDTEIRRICTIVNRDTMTQSGEDYVRLTIEVKTAPYAHLASTGNEEEQWEKDYFVWIEGVGLLCNYAEIGSKYLDTTVKSTLDCCVFPNIYHTVFDATNVRPVIPPAAIESVKTDEAAPDDGTLYDLSGREVTHPQKGSVYIRGHRKILWKD